MMVVDFAVRDAETSGEIGVLFIKREQVNGNDEFSAACCFTLLLFFLFAYYILPMLGGQKSFDLS